MQKKVKVNLQSHKKEYIKACGLGIGVLAIAFVSFRLGAQHGVDVFYEWLLKADPELHGRVDALFKKAVG